MEMLDQHKHPLEQAADAARFVVSHLAGGAWADLPRPVPIIHLTPGTDEHDAVLAELCIPNHDLKEAA
jgi:hypothetical protein